MKGGQRRLIITSPGTVARVWIRGPKWRRLGGVQAAGLALAYDFEEDIRELALERIRFDLPAMWSDPLEQLGVRRTTRQL